MVVVVVAVAVPVDVAVIWHKRKRSCLPYNMVLFSPPQRTNTVQQTHLLV